MSNVRTNVRLYPVLAGYVKHLGDWLGNDRQYYCVSTCGKGRHAYALILSTWRTVD